MAIKLPRTEGGEIENKRKRRIQILAPEILLKDVESSVIATSLTKLSSKWDSYYNELKSYYQANLHCNIEYFVGRFRKTDRELRKWIAEQRSLFRNYKLRADKIEKLEQIGIIWDFKEHNHDEDWYEWENNFYELVKYKKRLGDLSPGYPPLRSWLINMSKRMAEGTLEPHKVKLLKVIGVDAGLYLNLRKTQELNPKESRRLKLPRFKSLGQQNHSGHQEWISHFEKIKSWWETHDNYLFSQMEPELRRWAKEQCVKKKAGELPNDKISLLDQIEFPWNRF